MMTTMMMMTMTRMPIMMIRMRTMTTAMKRRQANNKHAGGEGEGCEDCSDKGAAGETVPSVL